MGVPSPPVSGRMPSVLDAKIQLPPLPARVVARDRLRDHPGWTTGGATLVVGGPGFGKTVATRQHCSEHERRGIHPCWLSIDQYDDHPPVFWAYVIAALQRHHPLVGREAAREVSRDVRSGDGLDVVLALLADLGRTREPVVLVLDDTHHVRERAALDQLAFFIEHLPAHVRLIMTARVEPALPISRWRGAGRIGELRTRDLRFTDDEGTVLLAQFENLALDDDQVRLLLDKLQGWAAAVQLAALSLRRREDGAASVLRWPGADRLVIDYLVGDVVDRLSTDDRDFLFTLSVLGRFDAPLAAALTGQVDAAERLHRLEGEGLFLVALDPAKSTYRFHHLFGELLQHELRFRGDTSLSGLHRRAGAALEQRGQLEEAMSHFLQAGDTVAALRLVPTTAAWVEHPAVFAVGHDATQDALSAREAALLALLPTHLSYREMGLLLYVSVNTVKTHLKTIYRKLGASSRTEAVDIARHRGLLP